MVETGNQGRRRPMRLRSIGLVAAAAALVAFGGLITPTGPAKASDGIRLILPGTIVIGSGRHHRAPAYVRPAPRRHIFRRHGHRPRAYRHHAPRSAYREAYRRGFAHGRATAPIQRGRLERAHRGRPHWGGKGWARGHR